MRVRTLYAMNGLCRLAILIALIVVSTYVLDRLLGLPRSVRMLMFFIAVSAILLEGARKFLYPMRKVLRSEDLAVTVEKRFPELGNQLVSSIQFAKSIDSPEFNDSKAMAVRTIEDTLEKVKNLRFARALTPGGVYRVAGIAAVCVVAVTTYASLNPEYSATWFRRIVALEDVQWPRQTFLQVVLPRQGHNLFVTQEEDRDIVSIAAGEDLIIRVKANGRVPRSVNLTYDVVSSDADSSRKVETRVMSKVGPRDFQYTFLGVTDSFEFFARGGDDQAGEPVYKVRVLPPPRVDSLALDCEYPPYTGRAPERVEGGSVEAPVGTRINLTLTANLDIDRAFLSHDTQEGRALQRVDSRTFTGTIQVDGNQTFAFLLHGTNGLKNTRPMRLRVRALPDLPPSLQVFGVAGYDFDATPEAALPIRVISTDDYGIADVRITARMGLDGEPVPVPLGADAHIPADAADATATGEFPVTTKVLTVALLDLPALQTSGAFADALEPGDVLFYQVAAIDTHTDPDGAPLPQKKETQPFRVQIVQRSELERKLNDWQAQIKLKLHKMISTQESIRTELLEFAEVDDGEDRLIASDAQSVLDAEIDQNRISNDANQVGREFRQIFNTYLYNRIENSPLTAKLIANLQDSARRFEQSEVERYRGIFERVSAGERQKSDILGKQLTMIQLALEISEDLSPSTTQHLAAARKADNGAERRRLIDVAIAKEQEILDKLEVLIRKMQEWEDFQEVLQETKDLIDLQKAVRKRTMQELQSEKDKQLPDTDQK